MFLNRILELVYPTRCVSCGRAGQLLCDDCRSELAPLERLNCVVCDRPAVGGVTHPVCRSRWAPERFLAAFPYRGPARKLVQALKYKRLRSVAKIMAELLVVELAETGVGFGKEAVIIPIPLSFWRKGARGFNQSELLGEAVAERLGLVFRRDLLKRMKDTESQVSLSKKDRARNIRGVFAAGGKFTGEDVLLVDDVVTTGATVREAARVLKQAGAGQVWVLAFAQD